MCRRISFQAVVDAAAARRRADALASAEAARDETTAAAAAERAAGGGDIRAPWSSWLPPPAPGHARLSGAFTTRVRTRLFELLLVDLTASAPSVTIAPARCALAGLALIASYSPL